MKILILIQCTNLGGMEQSTLLFINELAQLDINVEVISLNEIGEIGHSLKKVCSSVRGIPYLGKFGWRSFFKVRKALRSSDADYLLMVGHNLMGMLALGGRWSGRRVLSMHFHHRGVMSSWAWRIVYFLAAIQFKAIIFPSHFINNEAVEIAPWIGSLTNVISFPIPSHEVTNKAEQTAARIRIGLHPERFYVGNAGWLISRKRWDVFLKVAAQVAREIPDVHFLIAGDGPERETLQRLAHELGISEKITWMGWLKKLDDFYQSLNVMLFNSDWDAMGRTPLEAMSYGVPTVASVKNGGLGEMINDRKLGFFITEHDVGKMACEIIGIARNPQLADDYAHHGNHRIRDVGSAKVHTMRVLQALGILIPDHYRKLHDSIRTDEGSDLSQ